MKSNSLLLALCSCMGIANAAQAIVIDNINLPGLVTAGSQASFTVQSFTPNVAGVGTGDTVAANSPLTPQVKLTSASFVRSPLGTATTGSLFLDLYLGDGDDGTYLASSMNSVDVNSAAALSVMSWNFNSVLLNSTSQYALVFSTDNVAGGSVLGRVAAANNGAGFVNTYNGGTADDNGNNNSPLAFDTRFSAQFQIVPEPNSTALWALFAAGLICSYGLRMRRKRSSLTF